MLCKEFSFKFATEHDKSLWQVKRLLEHSRSLGRRQQSCMVHTAPAESTLQLGCDELRREDDDDQLPKARRYMSGFVSDIAIFVLKRDVKIQLTNLTCLADTTVQHDADICSLMSSLNWIRCCTGNQRQCWWYGWTFTVHLLLMSRAATLSTDWSGCSLVDELCTQNLDELCTQNLSLSLSR